MADDATAAFLSYSHEDSEFAIRLAEDLKAGGASVWIDQLDIKPDTPWDLAIEDALRKCPRMLVILSPASVSSDAVLDEVSFALSERKTVVPVLSRDCNIPLRLARLQHLDFRTDYRRGLEALLKVLGAEQAAEKARLIRLEQKEQPRAAVGPSRPDSARLKPPSQMKEGAVFISYSRTDQEAVETLYAKLTQAGIPAWYDAGLQGSAAAWGEKIQWFIETCSVFIPVLSTNALARTKAPFRGEWGRAVLRDSDYFGTGETDIVPVVVDEADDIRQAPRKFQGMPSRFKEVQMYHCPYGEPEEDLVECLRERLKGKTA